MKKKLLKLLNKTFAWIMVLTMILPYGVNAYQVYAEATNNVDIRDQFGEWYGIELIIEEILEHDIQNAPREVLTRRPRTFNVNNRRVDGHEILNRRTKNTRTYRINDEVQITEIYFDVMHKKVGDIYVEIDNTLEVGGYELTNKFGLYEISFTPKKENILTINNNLSISFPEGNFNNFSKEDNQIKFSNVFENVDIEYHLGNSRIHESIIFNAIREDNTFSYVVNIGNLDVRLENNYLCIYQNDDECEFEILSPFMEDRENNLHIDVEIDYERISDAEIKITYTFDLDWLNANERVFPVALNQSITPLGAVNVNIDSSWILTRSPDITGAGIRLWAGYDRNGFASGAGNANRLGHTRSFIYFPMPNIGQNREVTNATLELRNAAWNTPNVSSIHVYKTATHVPPATVTWNNQPAYGTLTRVSTNSIINQEWQTFNITSYVQDKNEGNRRTLQLRANPESPDIFPSAFFNERSPNLPVIVIEHRDNSDVDPGLDINLFDNNFRVFSRNINEFQAVSLDGIARPNSTVTFRLFRRNPNGTKTFIRNYTTTSSRMFVDPIFISDPIAGVQQILRENVNYTSEYFRRASLPLYNTMYGFNIVVSQGALTSTRYFETDEFKFYTVGLGDNLARISSHYGVPIASIMADNNMTSTEIREGDILFIRFAKDNPRLTPDMFTPRTTISSFQAEFRGMGPNCRYGCVAGNPVNIFTGNAFHESIDFTLNDFAEINLTRTHNSLGTEVSGIFGAGWTSNFDKFISFDRDGNLLYFRGDGGIDLIPRVNNNFVPRPQDDLEVTRSGNNIHIRDTFNRRTYIFNQFGVLIRKIDNNNNQMNIYRNDFQNVERITINGRREIRFHYNNFNLVSRIDLPNNTSLRYEYNNQRQLIRFIDANGNIENYNYDANSRILSILDRNGNLISRNTYDSFGRVTQQITPYHGAILFDYQNGTTNVTFGGRTESFDYDEEFRLTKQVFADGTYIEREYDNRNNLIKEINELGQIRTQEHDANDNIIKRVDFNGDMDRYYYDARGNVIRHVNPQGEVSEFLFDNNNNVIRHTDERGIVFHFTYNNLSQRTSESDELGNVTRFTYLNGNLRTKTHPTGLVETFYHDTVGNLIRIRDNQGRNDQFVFDNNNNVIREVNSYGHTIEREFDGNNNKIVEINTLGGRSTLTYDALNRLIKETHGRTFITFAYDIDNQIIRVENELGHVITFTYDSKGRKTSETDHLGNVATWRYDAAGNVIREVDRYGNITIFEYNDLGLQTRKLDSNGLLTRFEYDEYNRLVRIIYDSGIFSEARFDGNNNLIKKVDRYGGILEVEYDNNRNIIRESITTSTGILTTYNTFNSRNLLIRTEDSNGLITNFTYDTLGRKIRKENSDGKLLINSFDVYNNIISETNSNGVSRTFTYDLLGRRTSESDFYGNITRFIYDGEGNIVRTLFPNDSYEQTTFDAFGNQTSFTNALSHTTVYTYNDVGLIIKETDALGIETHFIYNNLNQLYRVYRYNKLIASFEYDQYDRIVRKQELGEWSLKELDSHSNIIRKENQTGLITYFSFDRNNNLIRERNNFNVDNIHVYDRNNRRIRTTDRNGRSETFTYDTLGNVLEHVSLDGIRTINVYDDYDRKISSTVNNVRTDFRHDLYGQVYQEVVNNLKITTNIFDNEGRTISVIDPMGFITLIEYDDMSNVVSQTDRNGNTTYFEHDFMGNVIRQTTALGHVTEFTYNAYGNVIRTENAEGHVTQYVYNSLGMRLESVCERGFKTYFEYDEHFRPSIITHPYGYQERITYDAHGNVSSIRHKNGVITRYTYDLGGRRTSRTDGNGNITRFEHDDYDNIIAEINPLGNRVNHRFNINNLLIKTYDRYGIINKFEYDEHQNLIVQIDANGNRTTHSYDKFNNRVRTVEGSRTTNKTYDLNGNLIETNLNNLIITRKNFDGEGNLLSEYRNDRLVQRSVYDADYNIISRTNDSGITINMTFNSIGLPITAGINGRVLFTYAYDAAGNLVREEDVFGNTRIFTFDAFNNNTSRTDSNGNVQKFGFDPVGNLIRVQDAQGNVMNYTYDRNNNLIGRSFRTVGVSYIFDAAGRKIRERDQYGATTTFVHDNRNNVIRSTKEGRTTTFQFDGNGNRISRQVGNINISYEFDRYDQLINMVDNIGTTTFEHDILGNIIKVNDANNNVINFEYDNHGNQAKIIHPNGTTIENVFNNFNEIERIIKNGQTIVTNEFNELNQKTRVIRSNGVITDKAYDDLGRKIAIINSREGNVISSSRYTLDGENNLIRKVLFQDNRTITKDFTFDERNMLIEEVINDNGEINRIQYQYDFLGNKRQITNGRVSKIHTYENGKLTEIRSENLTERFRYDDWGNKTHVIHNGRTVNTLTFDGFNRLIGFEDANYKYTFTYDGNDNRLSQTIEDKRVYYFMKTERQLRRLNIEELDFLLTSEEDLEASFEFLQAQMRARTQRGCSYVVETTSRVDYFRDKEVFTYVNDITRTYEEVLMILRNDEKYRLEIYNTNDRIKTVGETEAFYLTTRNGSISGKVDNTGIKIASYLYSSFGISNAEYKKFGYTGEMHDATGLIFLRARYYNPNISRFISKDTFKGWLDNLPSQNQYTYVHNNPHRYTDPSGHFALLLSRMNNAILQAKEQAKAKAKARNFMGPPAPAVMGPRIPPAPPIVNNRTNVNVRANDPTQGQRDLLGSSQERAAFCRMTANLRPYEQRTANTWRRIRALGQFGYGVARGIWSTVRQSITGLWNLPGKIFRFLIRTAKNPVGAAVNVATTVASIYNFASKLTGGQVWRWMQDTFKLTNNSAYQNGRIVGTIVAAVGLTKLGGKGIVWVQKKIRNSHLFRNMVRTPNQTPALTPAQLGQLGERAVANKLNLTKNTSQIKINGRTRIPDFMDRTNRLLIEVKNVRYATKTQQIKDMLAWVEANPGWRMILYVKDKSRVSMPLRNTAIEIRIIPL